MQGGIGTAPKRQWRRIACRIVWIESDGGLGQMDRE
jgi:hypothetical protein